MVSTKNIMQQYACCMFSAGSLS